MSLLICALALVQVPVSEPTTLRWAPRVGDTATFEISMELDSGDAKTTVEAVVEQTVTKVDTDGSYQATSKSLGALLRTGGQEVRDDRVVERTIQYGPRGEMLAVTRGAADFQVFMQATYLRFVAPAGTVVVGDKWTYQRPALPVMSVLAATVEYNYRSVEAGLAEVSFTFREEGEDAQVGRGTWRIDAVSGQPRQLNVEVTNFLGEKGTSATIRMQRR